MSSGVATDRKKHFFFGVLLLFGSAFLSKCIGLFYKIPLIRTVGVEGMAYFLAAYHIYSLLFVFSATGLPNALALLVAKAEAEGREGEVPRIFFASVLLFLTIGATGTVGLLVFAEPLAVRLSMRESAAAIMAIAPSLFLAGWIGAVRGFFQGKHNMLPTAISEVLEAVSKLVFGLAFSLIAVKKGADAPRLAAAAIAGITVGMCLSALFLLFAFLLELMRGRAKKRPAVCFCSLEHTCKRTRILPSLVSLALPMTVSASVMSLVSLVDTVLISGRLQRAGFAPSVANSMYSAFGNLAVPLYNLIPSLLSPLSLALMPMLCASIAKKEEESARVFLLSGLRLVAWISIPAALGLSVFSRPILSMIYGGETDAVMLAAPLLSLLAVSVVPACFVALTGSALQAMGHTASPAVAMAVGACLKFLTEYPLLTHPRVGILAAPISTLVCNSAVLFIQAIMLCRALPFRLTFGRDLFAPLGAAILSVGGGGVLYIFLSQRLTAISWAVMPIVIFLTVVSFLFFSLTFGAVKREDLANIPASERLVGILERLGFLKKNSQYYK